MSQPRILYSGILVGLAGSVSVAIWFFLYDLAAGVMLGILFRDHQTSFSELLTSGE